MKTRSGYTTTWIVAAKSALSFLVVVFTTTTTKTTTTLGFTIPDATKLPSKIFGTQLDFKVAFGSKENPFQIQGLHIELSESFMKQPSQRRKESSSGYYKARLITGDDDDDKNPYFINNKGLQKVTFDNGVWEIRWPKESPFGLLICSFNVPTTLQRNDVATLEEGRFWIHHRIWSKTSLESERQKRIQIQGEAAQYLKKRDEEIKKLTSDDTSSSSSEGGGGNNKNNALKRMVSYGKAAKSNLDFRGSGFEEAKYTPLYDDQVLVLDDDDDSSEEECILSTRGLIFRVGGESVVHRETVYAGESRVDFPKQRQQKQSTSSSTSSDDSTTIDKKEETAKLL